MNTSSPLLSKLSVTFVVLAGLIAIAAAYVLIGSVTITITPTTKSVEHDIDVVVGNTGGDTTLQILDGSIWNETVTLSKTFSVGDAFEELEGKASGEIRIVNNNSSAQTLVGTTRFLASDQTLYRLDRQVTIPARSSLVARITADKPGPIGDRIGPATFSIPGLNPAMQQKVYGELEGSLTGGIIRRGKLTQADIDRGIAVVTDALAHDAQVNHISNSLSETGIPEKVSLPESLTQVEILEERISAPAGELVDNFEITLTARVTGVSYDRNDLIQISQARLITLLPEGEELVALDPSALEVTLTEIDPLTQTATLSVHTTGKSLITPSAHIVTKSDIIGLTPDELNTHFQNVPGVESVHADFRPFWVKRVPRLMHQINIVIK